MTFETSTFESLVDVPAETMERLKQAERELEQLLGKKGAAAWRRAEDEVLLYGYVQQDTMAEIKEALEDEIVIPLKHARG